MISAAQHALVLHPWKVWWKAACTCRFCRKFKTSFGDIGCSDDSSHDYSSWDLSVAHGIDVGVQFPAVRSGGIRPLRTPST